MVDKTESIVLEWEKVSDSFDGLSHLFNAHYLEIYKKEVDVKKDTLLTLESQGSLYLLVARKVGVPIGYYSCIVIPSIYNTSEKESRDIGIYIVPSERNKGITTTMQKVMDTALIGNGVSSLIVSYPKESSIPKELGYTIKEIIYERRLECQQ